jgi:DNA-binding MarR family transcriptional regulator
MLVDNQKVWHHTFYRSIKESILSACPIPKFRIPKYERLTRLAERFGGVKPEQAGMQAYLLLISLVAEMHEIGNATLAKHGLGEGRCGVLFLLLENLPEPLSHSQLAELLGVTKGSITGLVDGLEVEGLVKREDAGEDRRMRLISLTPTGMDLAEKAMSEKFNFIRSIMAGLTPAESETLVRLLLKVQEGLPAHRDE